MTGHKTLLSSVLLTVAIMAMAVSVTSASAAEVRTDTRGCVASHARPRAEAQAILIGLTDELRAFTGNPAFRPGKATRHIASGSWHVIAVDSPDADPGLAFVRDSGAGHVLVAVWGGTDPEKASFEHWIAGNVPGLPRSLTECAFFLQ